MMIPGVEYYISTKFVPNDARLNDKMDGVIELLAMYLHHKHPDKSLRECFPNLVIMCPGHVSGQVIVKYYVNQQFICEFELEKLTKYRSDNWGLIYDLHETCLDADSNFSYYLGLDFRTPEGQRNLLGLDLADKEDITAIGKDWFTHGSNS